MRFTSIILILSFLLPALAPWHTASAAQARDPQDAYVLQAFAHSCVDGVDSIETLQEMRAAHVAAYDRLIAKADGTLKTTLEARRDAAARMYDQKVSALSQNRSRPRGLRGFLRRVGTLGDKMFRGVKQGLGWTGKTVAKGVVNAVKTTVRSLPTTPQQLIPFLIEHSIGGFSPRRLFKGLAVDGFKRSVEKDIFGELVRLTRDPKLLDDFIKLNRATGGRLKIDEGFVERYKEYLAQRNAGGGTAEGEDAADDDGFASMGDLSEGDVGYEGEGGYDDPNEDQAPAASDAQSDYEALFRAIIAKGYSPVQTVSGTMTLTDFELSGSLLRLSVRSGASPPRRWTMPKRRCKKTCWNNWPIQKPTSTSIAPPSRPIRTSPSHLRKPCSSVTPVSAPTHAYFALWAKATSTATTSTASRRGASLTPAPCVSTAPPVTGTCLRSVNEWAPVPISSTYEATLTIDEDGYLHISGTNTQDMIFAEIRVEDEGLGLWGSDFIYHMVKATVVFDLKSDAPHRGRPAARDPGGLKVLSMVSPSQRDLI